MEREYQYDNIKAFLIFCVVLGHGLEDFLVGGLKTVYVLIYSFHMPMFVFISGMFARYEPKRIVKKLLLPYLLFQIIYCLMYGEGHINIQFLTPIWVLWYLFAMIVWSILIPFIDLKKTRERKLLFAGSILLALMVGFNSDIGYYMSLSRIVVYFPFFLLGFYYRRLEKMQIFFKNLDVKYLLVAALAVTLTICYISEHLNVCWIYGSYDYVAMKYNFEFRIFFYICAVVLGAAILKIVPAHRTVYSKIGHYTMPIYLCHGILLGGIQPFTGALSKMNEIQLLITLILITAFIVWGLGRDWRLPRNLFDTTFITEIKRKRKNVIGD